MPQRVGPGGLVGPEKVLETSEAVAPSAAIERVAIALPASEASSAHGAVDQLVDDAAEREDLDANERRELRQLLRDEIDNDPHLARLVARARR